jgi:hypothetical protein
MHTTDIHFFDKLLDEAPAHPMPKSANALHTWYRTIFDGWYHGGGWWQLFK